jgi:hypothetical protein
VSTVDKDVTIAVCSFCLRPNTEVNTLVAGPGVFICDGCVALCSEVIAAKPTSAASHRVAPWEIESTLEDILTSLPRIAAAGAQVEQNLVGWVRKARSLGATWALIGEALLMTRQSAWERFSGEP